MKIKFLILLLAANANLNAQWQAVYTFTTPSYPLSFIAVDGALYTGLDGGGVLKSEDSGETWNAVNNGIQMGGAVVYSLAFRNDSIYAGGFGEVSFSNNGGESWSLLDLNLWFNNNVYALTVKDQYLFAGVGSDDSTGVFRKELSGGTWTQMNNGLPDNVDVYALVEQNGVLMAGTGWGVYKSLDNGETWELANFGIAEGLAVNALYVSGEHLLAGTSDGVYTSADLGSSWALSEGMPSNSFVLSFASNGDVVLSGTYEGAYLSTDHGLSWMVFNEGVNEGTFFNAMTYLEDHFYAGTTMGILKVDAPLTNAVFNENSFDQKDWSLYPNPFITHTTMELSEPLTDGTLTIYNLLGQRVGHMVHLTGQAVVFDKGDLPCGQYFIRLTDGGALVAADKLIIADQ